MRKAVGVLVLALVVGTGIAIAVFGKQSQQKETGQPPRDEATPTQTSQATESTTPSTEATQSMTLTPKPTMTPIPTTKQTSWTNSPAMTVDPKKTYRATMVTDKGTIRINLFVSEDPVTVNNFVFLSRQGFYDNVIFHRVMRGFMIQGGDPTGTGTGSPGYRFNDEPITRDYKRGTIAMANSGPNTNGSQFFIMHADYPLPKNYVIFGSIDPADTASLATLDTIATALVTTSGTGETSKPTQPVHIQSVTIDER